MFPHPQVLSASAILISDICLLSSTGQSYSAQIPDLCSVVRKLSPGRELGQSCSFSSFYLLSKLMVLHCLLANAWIQLLHTFCPVLESFGASPVSVTSSWLEVVQESSLDFNTTWNHIPSLGRIIGTMALSMRYYLIIYTPVTKAQVKVIFKSFQTQNHIGHIPNKVLITNMFF